MTAAVAAARAAAPSLADVVDRHRLLVCVGTGGVGKTTVAAALGLGAALRGRRAMVLTIDPARALARALGLDALRPGGEPVPAAALAAADLAPRGALDAGMLDQKRAWDELVRRLAPGPDTLARILANPFYQALSTSFSGSTEYMAIEETCRLMESGRYDLVVLDTPPAAHAVDFLRAPERIDRLLDAGAARLIAGALGRGVRAAGATARLVVRRLERATGGRTLADIAAFFAAADALWTTAAERSARARALLSGADAAFVLVTTPHAEVWAETAELADRMRAQAAPLAALVLNRVHAAPGAGLAPGAAARLLGALAADPSVDPAAAGWLAGAWQAAVAEGVAEDAIRARCAAALPALAHAAVPEAAHDLHALGDLARVAAALWDGGAPA